MEAIALDNSTRVDMIETWEYLVRLDRENMRDTHPIYFPQLRHHLEKWRPASS
jgi:hypothetical protein